MLKIRWIHTSSPKKKLLRTFFFSVKNILRDEEGLVDFPQHWTEKEKKLHEFFLKSQNTVDERLKDNFDTARAFQALLDLVSETHVYTKGTKDLRIFLIKKIAAYVTKILKVFGLIESDSIGFAQTDNNSQQSFETSVRPYVESFLNFRKEVRDMAKTKQPHNEFLSLSDKLRDEVLPPLGLKLTDTELKFVWDIVDPKTLLDEMKGKKAGALTASVKKLEATSKKLGSAIEKLESAKKPASEYFSLAEYSLFDDKGIPTHTADGKEITNSAKKTLAKGFEQHKKNHALYQEELKGDADFLNKKKAEHKRLTQEIQSLQEELKHV